MKQKILIVGDGRSILDRALDVCFRNNMEPSITKCPFCSYKDSCEAYIDLTKSKD